MLVCGWAAWRIMSCDARVAVQVVVISAMLAGVACISSLLLLVLSMQARGSSFIARVVSNGLRNANDWSCCEGVQGRFVSWGEMQTMMYLKISLSDFFTVFAARCRWGCVSELCARASRCR